MFYLQKTIKGVRKFKGRHENEDPHYKFPTILDSNGRVSQSFMQGLKCYKTEVKSSKSLCLEHCLRVSYSNTLVGQPCMSSERHSYCKMCTHYTKKMLTTSQKNNFMEIRKIEVEIKKFIFLP